MKKIISVEIIIILRIAIIIKVTLRIIYILLKFVIDKCYILLVKLYIINFENFLFPILIIYLYFVFSKKKKMSKTLNKKNIYHNLLIILIKYPAISKNIIKKKIIFKI